jgi:hypothetical protein
LGTFNATPGLVRGSNLRLQVKKGVYFHAQKLVREASLSSSSLQPSVAETGHPLTLAWSAVQGPAGELPRSLPFYAGWDERLRKLVITNRFLSVIPAGMPGTQEPFLQGSNNNVAVNWKFPFAIYAQDQFFPLAVKAFSPIKWRRMEFRNNLLNTWRALKAKPTRFNQAQQVSGRSPVNIDTFSAAHISASLFSARLHGKAIISPLA